MNERPTVRIPPPDAKPSALVANRLRALARTVDNFPEGEALEQVRALVAILESVI